MPISPKCECGHAFFMHTGAGNHSITEAGSCRDTVKGKKVGDRRTNCQCSEYVPVSDGTNKKA